MVDTLGELTKRDRRLQFEAGEKTSDTSAYVSHIFGHERFADLGYQGGVFPGTPQSTHAQLCLNDAEQSWGPLRPGLYQFCIGDVASPFVPGASGVHFRLSDAPGDDATEFDFPMLCTEQNPYFEVRLRSGQTHINFHNISGGTISIFCRRLI